MFCNQLLNANHTNHTSYICSLFDFHSCGAKCDDFSYGLQHRFESIFTIELFVVYECDIMTILQAVIVPNFGLFREYQWLDWRYYNISPIPIFACNATLNSTDMKGFVRTTEALYFIILNITDPNSCHIESVHREYTERIKLCQNCRRRKSLTSLDEKKKQTN